MVNPRPPRRIGPADRPTRFLSYKALIAVLTVMLMVLVSVSCASSDDSEIFEFAVGPEIRDCVGVAPMRCMVVNGELFYDAIEGFDYVEGFDYLLRVERYDAWPDQEEPPQDASRYGYRLIEVISKTRRM